MTKNKNNIVNVTEYIDTKYREYAIYTNNERAIPSVVDGFKPVQRKAIYCAIKDAKKFIKVSSLAGSLPRIAAYHHGTASAEDAIISLTKTYSNNIPFLEGDGTFGTRLSPTAGAARYIFTKLSPNFEKLFKDNEVLPMSDDVDDHPEPLFYLPIIPTVLLNGVQGIAVGFATKIAPRSHTELSKACIQYLEGKRITQKLLPSFPDFEGDVTKVSDGVYKVCGSYRFIGKSKYNIEITEIPIGKSHEQYIEILNKLVETKVINSYEDHSSEKFNFIVKFPQNKELSHEYIVNKLKLEENFNENITVVNEFKKEDGIIGIDVYDDPFKLLKDFVDFRLKFYDRRFQYHIGRLTSAISLAEDKYRFVREIITKKLNIGKMTRKEVIDYLTNDSRYNNDNIQSLTTMSIFSMTSDTLDKIKDEIDRYKAEVKDWKSKDAKEVYIEELKVLAKG